MLFYKRIIIISLILIITLSLYAEKPSTNNNNIDYLKKDPFIAGLLSAAMMGLGQFYTKDYLSGSMFVLNDFIQKGLLVLLIANFSDKYTNDEQGDQVVEWQEINKVDKGIAIGFVAYYFGTRLYCIIDAMASAEKYNKNLEKEFVQTKYKFNYLISQDTLSLSLSRSF